MEVSPSAAEGSGRRVGGQGGAPRAAVPGTPRGCVGIVNRGNRVEGTREIELAVALGFSFYLSLSLGVNPGQRADTGRLRWRS